MKDSAAPPDQPGHYSRSPISFLLFSLLCQLIAFAATVSVFRAFYAGPQTQNPISFPVIGGGLVLFATIAWGCASFLRLPPLWRIFNALLLPLVISAEVLSLPGYIYGIGIFAALILYLPTLWTRVPYYPTSLAMYEAVLSALPKEQPVRFADLGCGFSGLLCYLARNRPESSFTGVELSPLAFLVSKLRVALAGLTNVEIRFKSLWDLPLQNFSVVYAFLAPPPMEALWEKVASELPRGGTFFVNSFPVPGLKAAAEIPVPGTRQQLLYRYEAPGTSR